MLGQGRSLWLGRRLPGGNDAATGMNKGGTVEVAGINVTMVHADHSPATGTPAARPPSISVSREVEVQAPEPGGSVS